MTVLFQFLFLFQHSYDENISDGVATGLGIVSAIFIFIVAMAFVLLLIICLWKIFTKAGKEGWAAIIPFFNYYVMLQIVGRPGWWLLLYLIPCVNIIVHIMVTIDLAKSFGKDTGFALGMIFLPFIFYPILAFGDATYKGPSVVPPMSGGTTV